MYMPIKIIVLVTKSSLTPSQHQGIRKFKKINEKEISRSNGELIKYFIITIIKDPRTESKNPSV